MVKMVSDIATANHAVLSTQSQRGGGGSFVRAADRGHGFQMPHSGQVHGIASPTRSYPHGMHGTGGV
jgi:hypothetical protein